jgi:hypothetical protein
MGDPTCKMGHPTCKMGHPTCKMRQPTCKMGGGGSIFSEEASVMNGGGELCFNYVEYMLESENIY